LNSAPFPGPYIDAVRLVFTVLVLAMPYNVRHLRVVQLYSYVVKVIVKWGAYRMGVY
jgi:hypothetical protein